MGFKPMLVGNPNAPMFSAADASPRSNETNMSEITREELDAKLATIEAKADARLSDYQRMSTEVLAGFRSDNAEFKSRIDQSLADLKLDIHSIKNIKALLGAATAVIVGTIFAAFALSGQFFDSGRDTAQLVQEAKQQSADTRKLLEEIQAQQHATTPGGQSPPPTPANPQNKPAN